MPVTAINQLPVIKVNASGSTEALDKLAAEEPLEIRLEFGDEQHRQTRNVSVTMRTPGNDAELALGFLFTEGIICDADEVENIAHCFAACDEDRQNVIQVALKPGVQPNLQNTGRNFYTTSSCGVCGKSSIHAIRTVSAFGSALPDHNSATAEILNGLPAILSRHQDIFDDTGGLHASALFTNQGELRLLREDVGRHNALDKLIGVALDQDLLPLNQHILLLSGRTSFELVQKAVMVGITIIAAIGAPSTLAVQLADEFNVTLIGFLRDGRFNIYTSAHRVKI
ncbi:formate dehydrogenase accessory protein FdhD [Mucilaginibacter sp. PPCGB 2223]|uniref:formate dehydrogenase accessory sulfurtransferase FdhD n=1 Tax=Mucilaginibacter sp. PPCGB 2223 TaxID=1886027 RepID=UPI000825BD24|nr:formate dehydrogenase accessory sulfurtransferase FdhD [Mucilaginibacter sp. PPCGB 2223]OCX51146.1 formate dehydrogenase accessory protein FdhD [Mucilaginibacter sp. PPCGB 2223]